ncbi:MFS transporter [Sphingopyxis sp. PET50]|uniref:MFS transporter n=1 Tax=Sphingopyxis sp. PET50 TaxID=2976533 RepID=UPI0021AEEFE3|nr:MFS transporter [Sphingopyxis sp. PET50]
MTQASASPLDGGAMTAGLALRRNVALAMLFLVGTINFVDRQLLSVLVEPIRAEMDFSDTQFGLLTGFAFALFYAAAGVPVAMIADRWNRVKLIGIACVVWSGFTAACGMVSNFWQLAAMRFGVGAGEAGGTAPSLSVLADYYPPAQRPLISGIFTLNGPFGVFVGTAFGAWAAAAIGWRSAFLAVGLAGLIVAPLLVWLVREPPRGQMDARAATEESPGFLDCFAAFVRLPSLRLVMIGSGLAAFVSYGMLNWIPAFLMRTQKMPLEAMASWYAASARHHLWHRHSGRGMAGQPLRRPFAARLWRHARARHRGAGAEPDRRAARRQLAALAGADARADGGLHRLYRSRPRAGAEFDAAALARHLGRAADADVQHRRIGRRAALRGGGQRCAETPPWRRQFALGADGAGSRRRGGGARAVRDDAASGK